MQIIAGVLEEGLIYAFIALGIYITYRILDFPDLSVDGTFPLGGAVTAAVLSAGVNPFSALLISFAAGALAGMVTGLIHVKLKVRDLLSGIITMTALYSVNLRIAGKANVPLFSKVTIFSGIASLPVPEWLSPFMTSLTIFIIVLIGKFLLDAYMKTRSGYLLRAAGDNETLVTSLARDKGTVKIVGLSIANGFAALAGSVYCQQKQVFDVNMGTGTMVIGLASVIIGTKLFRHAGRIKDTTSVIAGSIVYKACVSIAIACGMAASDLKLITSVLFLVILVVSMDRNRKKKAVQHD
jgi:putative ABC transport system permease protein